MPVSILHERRILNDLTDSVINAAAMLSVWETIAVVLAVAYLVLAIQQNIWCWAAAFASTAIYLVLM